MNDIIQTPDAARASAARQIDPLAWSHHYGGEERRERALATVDKVEAILKPRIITDWEEIRKTDPIHIDNVDGKNAEAWLTEHDDGVKAEAWEQGRAAMVEYQQGARRKVPYPVNPYRTTPSEVPVTNPEDVPPEWEYGWYYDADPDRTVFWYVFGILRHHTPESVRHTADKSRTGNAVIVRRPAGETRPDVWELVA